MISVDKYNMFSLFIPIVYGIQWFQKSKFISPCFHIYHLGRSIYDRSSFHSKCDHTSHFINHDFTKNNSHYVLTGIDYNYGLSITEMASVTGLVSDILSYFSTRNDFFNHIESFTHNYRLYNYLNKTKFETYSKYAFVTTMTLTVLNMLIGSSSAAIQINYDVYTENQESELYQNEVEIINYTIED